MSALGSPVFNVDAGELEGEPRELWSLAHLLHVACGGHAGDEASMRRALQRARETGAHVGAHPSYPDREGFGRRATTLTPSVVADSLRAQCAALRQLADEAGLALTSVKPHGALYHDAARSPELARVLAEVTRDLLGGGAALVGPPTGALRDAASAAGLRYLREGFADRGYGADGALLPRSADGALLTDPQRAIAQARALWATGAVDTLCVHGDNPAALPLLRALRAALS